MTSSKFTLNVLVPGRDTYVQITPQQPFTDDQTEALLAVCRSHNWRTPAELGRLLNAALTVPAEVVAEYRPEAREPLR